MKKAKLYSIYNKGVHLGNQKGFSVDDAIKKHLIASSLEQFLCDTKFINTYSATLAIENMHLSRTVFLKNKKTETPNKNENYWSFIESYYPNYSSCDQVLLSDILTRKLEGVEIDIDLEEMIKDWNVKEELLKLDQSIMKKAMANFFETNYI